MALKFDGSPTLDLNDADGNLVADFGVDKDGPDLTLDDTNGKIRATLGVTQTVDKITGATNPTAPFTITFFDKKGNVLFQRS